jgi:PKD domain-containing protein
VSLAVAAGCLGDAEASLAAPTWLAPKPVSAAGGVGEVRVIAEDGGGVIAAWSRFAGGKYQTEYAYRPPGGQFSAPAPVSPAAESWYLRDLAGNGRGDALMVMESQTMGQPGIGLSRRTAGGAFTQLDEISNDGFGQDVDAAVGADGTMAAIWLRDDAGDTRAELSVRPAGTSVFSVPDFASGSMVEADNTALAVGPDGTVVALWREQHAINIFEYFATALAPGQTTVAARQRVSLDDGLAIGGPALEVAGDGTAIAIWDQRVGMEDRIYRAVRPPGQTFAPSAPLSAAGVPGGLQVAVDSAGNAVAAWHRSNGGQPQVEASSRPAGGNFGSVQTVGPASSTYPGVDFGGDGSAIIMWQSSADYAIRAAHRAPGATLFGPPTPAVADNGVPLSIGNLQSSPLAMDAQGNAVVGFARGGQAAAAPYDAAGPTLTGLSIPAAGARGAALTLAVSATDVWSPITSMTWAFGDGKSTTGTSVSHAYATTGAFSARVTATDAVGNATSATRQVTVSDELAPRVVLTIPRGQRLARVLKRGLRARVRSNEAARARVDALVGRRLLRRPKASALSRVGRRSRSLRAARTTTVTVKLSRKARLRLAGLRRVRVTVRVRVTDPSGNSGRATRRVTLRR